MRLDDFQQDGGCKISEYGKPLCTVNTKDPLVLKSLLTNLNGRKQFSGTYRYKNKEEWIDDILVPVEWATKLYNVMLPFPYVEFEPLNASDHALVSVVFNLR